MKAPERKPEPLCFGKVITPGYHYALVYDRRACPRVTLHFDMLIVLSLPKEPALFYPALKAQTHILLMILPILHLRQYNSHY